VSAPHPQAASGAPSTRREFLARAGLACLSAGAAGWLGWRFHDPDGPAAAELEPPAPALPDYSVRELAPRMCIARGRNRAVLVRAACAALGGLGVYIHRGDRVLLKVNAAFATPPLIGATTHPELLAEMIRLCFAAGAERVVVGDNPINDPASCFDLTGIGPAARAAGAELVAPAERLFRPASAPGGALIRNGPVLGGALAGINKVIALAPAKDHHRSGASLTMKNWYGLLGGRRNVFHQDIHNTIKELALLVRPTLVVLDGVQTMITNGPTGGALDDLRATDTLVVGTDPVAVDAFGAGLLGKTPADLPFIGLAAAAGAGTADYEALRPIRVEA